MEGTFHFVRGEMVRILMLRRWAMISQRSLLLTRVYREAVVFRVYLVFPIFSSGQEGVTNAD